MTTLGALAVTAALLAGCAAEPAEPAQPAALGSSRVSSTLRATASITSTATDGGATSPDPTSATPGASGTTDPSNPTPTPLGSDSLRITPTNAPPRDQTAGLVAKPDDSLATAEKPADQPAARTTLPLPAEKPAPPAAAPAMKANRPPDLAAFRITGDAALAAKQDRLSARLAAAPDIPAAAALVQGKNCHWSAWVNVASTVQATQCSDGATPLYLLFYFASPADGATKDAIGRATLGSGQGNLVYINATGNYTIAISTQYLRSITVT
ncbi:hypothetical protein JT358_03005 [Micrococcales bacterium 31B]|nr:hypothetical protein [Micrococcales bacterium 31B]